MKHAEGHLKKIVLNLARCKEHPNGSIRHGYEFVAPLDQNSHIDVEAWKSQRSACIVRRFWGDEPMMKGVLVHRSGGAGGATWSFDYDRSTHADDEAGFHFGDHAFTPGEYVSVRDPEGEMHTFKIVSVL